MRNLGFRLWYGPQNRFQPYVHSSIINYQVVRKLSSLSLSGYEVIAKNPFVDIYRCSAFRLEALTPGVMMIDGEAFHHLDAVQGEIMKGAASVIAG